LECGDSVVVESGQLIFAQASEGLEGDHSGVAVVEPAGAVIVAQGELQPSQFCEGNERGMMRSCCCCGQHRMSGEVAEIEQRGE